MLGTEVSYLLPGQDRCVALPPQNGKKRVEYSYCTERGELFSCIASTVEAAQDMCEQWMLRQERGLNSAFFRYHLLLYYNR